MAPVEPTDDYYAVLEICQTADLITIKASYRRLAKIRHPDKAVDKLKATADFQRVRLFDTQIYGDSMLTVASSFNKPIRSSVIQMSVEATTAYTFM